MGDRRARPRILFQPANGIPGSISKSWTVSRNENSDHAYPPQRYCELSERRSTVLSDGTAGSRHRATLSQPPSGKKISTYGSTPAARSSHWPTHRLGVANSVLGAGGEFRALKKETGFRNFSSAAKRRKEFLRNRPYWAQKSFIRPNQGLEVRFLAQKPAFSCFLAVTVIESPIEICGSNCTT